MRLFFAINGPASIYTNYRPLPVPSAAAAAIALVGLLTLAVYWRTVFRRNLYLIFFALISVGYCLILVFDQYGMYKQTAQPVAINGRYLLPIIPLMAVILGRGLSIAFAKTKLVQFKAGLAVLAVVLLLHGGGLFTFVLRSDESWYWPNHSVQTLNERAQRVLSPITIEGSK